MVIVCLGISHQTADVGMREKFAVADTDLVDASRIVTAREGMAESVIVSTCNRVEFYAAAETAGHGIDGLAAVLRERAGEHHYNPSVFYQHQSPDSIRHLFRVVSGLDSMVIGETEILGQVKKAYQAAAEGGTTSRHLNKLFQRAFRVAKEVRTRTSITRGPVSVAAAAVELAEKIFGGLGTSRVLILGAGETGEQTARALLSRGAGGICVANRSPEKAERLATEMGGKALPFEEWERHCDDIDILIGSTAAPHAVVTRDGLAALMQRRKDRPLFVIDLAVPRDVEPSVNEIDGVYLYDMDSLQAIARQSLEFRRRELVTCEGIIDKHVAEFAAWLSGEHAAPGRNGRQPLHEGDADLARTQ
jgi:glutamyl-tRNA reductase